MCAVVSGRPPIWPWHALCGESCFVRLVPRALRSRSHLRTTIWCVRVQPGLRRLLPLLALVLLRLCFEPAPLHCVFRDHCARPRATATTLFPPLRHAGALAQLARAAAAAAMPAINISALESAKIFERFASDDNLWWALVRGAQALPRAQTAAVAACASTENDGATPARRPRSPPRR